MLMVAFFSRVDVAGFLERDLLPKNFSSRFRLSKNFNANRVKSRSRKKQGRRQERGAFSYENLWPSENFFLEYLRDQLIF